MTSSIVLKNILDHESCELKKMIDAFMSEKLAEFQQGMKENIDKIINEIIITTDLQNEKETIKTARDEKLQQYENKKVELIEKIYKYQLELDEICKEIEEIKNSSSEPIILEKENHIILEKENHIKSSYISIEDTKDLKITKCHEKQSVKKHTSNGKITRNVRPRPKGDQLYTCFGRNICLKLRYGKKDFYGYLKFEDKNISVSENNYFQNDTIISVGEQLMFYTLNSWVEFARDTWLKTNSSKNAYEVVSFWNLTEWCSIIDITPDTRY